jgi:uncharacterized protein YbaR (Trm112 family)
MEIPKEMLELLLCPKCKRNIVLDAAGNRIICKHCKLCYQIKDGIPIMLIDEAKPIEEDDV